MAAPSDTTWGNEISSGNSAGKIGISRTWSDQGDYEHVDVTVWFWTKYDVTDSYNSFYYARDTEPEYKGSVNIKHTVSSGSGWSESNQTILATYSYDLPKTVSDYTTYFNASITGIDALGSGNVSYASRPYTVYALDAVVYTQTVYARYQQTDGSWSEYSAVISDNYEFGSTVSWSRESDIEYKAASISYIVSSENTSYVDIYRNEYPIYFESNGGLFTLSPQYYLYGGTTKLSKYRPTKSGYKFLGWSLNADATSATYSHQDNFTFDDSEPILYAVWEKLNQDNIYLYNDGTCYVAEFIEDNVNGFGFGSGGRLYGITFDESKSENGTFEIGDSFIGTSFVEGLPS